MSEKKLNTNETLRENPVPVPEAQKGTASAAPEPLKAAGVLEAENKRAPQAPHKPQPTADADKKADQAKARNASQGKGKDKKPASPKTPSAMSPAPAADTKAAMHESASEAPAEVLADTPANTPANTPAAQAGEPARKLKTASTTAPLESNEAVETSKGPCSAEGTKASPKEAEAQAAGAPTLEKANAERKAPESENSPEALSKVANPQGPNGQIAGAETAAPAASGEQPAAASQAVTSGAAARIESQTVQTAETADAGKPSVSSSDAPAVTETAPRKTPRAETKAQAPEGAPADDAKTPGDAPDKDETHDDQASGNSDSEKASTTKPAPHASDSSGPGFEPAQRLDADNLIKEKKPENPERSENVAGEAQTAPESDPDKNPRAPARGELRAPKSGKEPAAPAASEAKGSEAAQGKAADAPAETEAQAGNTEHSTEDQTEGQAETEAKTEAEPLFSESAPDAFGPEADSDAPAPAGVTGLRAQPLLTRGQRIGASAMAAVALAVGLAIFGATRNGSSPEAAPKADSVITSPKTLSLPPVPPVPALLPEKAIEKPKAPAAADPEPEESPDPKPAPPPPVPDIRTAARTSGARAAPEAPATPASPVEKKPTEAEERYGAPLALTSTAPEKERTTGRGSQENGSARHGSASSARLAATSTDSVRARAIGGRSLLLPKGTVIECVLETRIDTTVPGMTTCVIPRDVWSADGRVLLLEKGSKATGEYRGAVQKGLARVFLLWNRIVTPRGVAIDLDSPAADPLGGAGIPGSVDHHWWARFGNALLFSLVQDAFDFGVARETKAAGGVNYYSSTTDSMDEIVKEAMRQAGDIPPTLTKPQGSRISLVAARDLDFSDVYRVAVAEAALPARLPAQPPAWDPALEAQQESTPQGGTR